MRKDALKFTKKKYFNGHSSSRSVHENFYLVTSFIQEAADKHIPSKTSRSVNSIPWITPVVRRMILKRNRTHAIAKKTGNSRLKTRFQELRKEIKTDIKKQHELYVNNLVGDTRANPRNFYRYTNSQRKDSQGIPPLKKRDGHGLAESESNQAEEFDGQFTGVFTQSSFNEVPLFGRPTTRMNDIVVSTEGLTRLLKGLNSSKTMGPDELHPRILKELEVELGTLFAQLFQQSLDTGKIPEEWSLANICPLFKKGDRALASNYRPVSLTYFLCRLLEHIVYSNIMDYLEKHSL